MGRNLLLPRGDLDDQAYLVAMAQGGLLLAQNFLQVQTNNQNLTEDDFGPYYTLKRVNGAENSAPQELLFDPQPSSSHYRCAIGLHIYVEFRHQWENEGGVGPWSHLASFLSQFRIETAAGANTALSVGTGTPWTNTNSGDAVPYDGVTDWAGTSGGTTVSPVFQIHRFASLPAGDVPGLTIRNITQFTDPAPTAGIATLMNTKWACCYIGVWLI